MTKGRLEAFTDGVIAIIITILVLELRPPHGADLAALRPLIPTALSYVLTFVFIAIYWNNHHHLLHTARHVDGRILWANIHLLFWLSITPFATAWMGDNHFAPLPVAAYGGVLFLLAISFTILVRALIRRHGPQSTLARAVGGDARVHPGAHRVQRDHHPRRARGDRHGGGLVNERRARTMVRR